jgi:hypothetical protein
MYKLGVLDPSGLEPAGLAPSGEDSVLSALFAERDFSGAVSMPVMAEGSIYYRGVFSEESRLMRYPEAENALTGRRTALRLEPWEPVPAEAQIETLAEAQAKAQAEAQAEALAEAQAEALTDAEAPPEELPLRSGKLYFPLKYYNPLLFWLPMPLVQDTREGISLEGGGVLTLIMDPAGINQVLLEALVDVPSEMVDTELSWTNRNLGFPLRFYFKDTVDKTEYKDRRVTETSVSGVFSYGLGIAGLSGGLIPAFHVTFTAWDDLRGSGAYSWKYNDDPIYSFQLGAEISNLYCFPWESFGHGFRLSNYARMAVYDKDFERPYSYPGYSGMLQTAFEPLFPARLSFYGAWDEFGINLKGQSSADLVFKDLAPSEYYTAYLNRVEWLVGMEAETLLFSFNIQRNLSHLYFNRIFGTLAYRAALYDASLLSYPKGNALGEKLRLTQSLILRLNLDTATIFVTPMPVKFTPVFLAGLRLTNNDNGPDAQSPFWFGFSYKLEY